MATREIPMAADLSDATFAGKKTNGESTSKMPVVASVVVLGLLALAGYGLSSVPQGPFAGQTVEAVFPTALWIAAGRQADAQSASPQIGSNINAGPDTIAKYFDNGVGMDFLRGFPINASIVWRTKFFDQAWMGAYLHDNIRQFVVLAAGLDARAWRMPVDAATIVYEVDGADAFAYKENRIPKDVPTKCTRKTVAADLRDPQWPSKLKAAGFDAKKPSFILIEGLTMYLPYGAHLPLFQKVSSLMAPGSAVAWDALTNDWALGEAKKDQYGLPTPNLLMAKHNVTWTWAEPVNENKKLVGAAGLTMKSFSEQFLPPPFVKVYGNVSMYAVMVAGK